MVQTSVLTNPSWRAEDFLFFCCPDCDEKSKEKEIFIKHIYIHIFHEGDHSNDEPIDEPIDDIEYKIEVKEDPTESKNDPIIEDDHSDEEETKCCTKHEVCDNNLSNSQEVDQNSIEKVNLSDGFSNVQKDTKRKRLLKPKEHSKKKKNSSRLFNFSCWECDLSSLSKPQLKEHMINVHGHDDMFKCPHCEALFKHKENLGYHKALKHGEGTLETIICTQCTFTTNRKYKMNRHVKAKHEETVKNVLCSFCPKTFTDVKAVRNHIKSMHTFNKFNCSECSELFKSVQEVRNHMIDVHKRQSFNCPKCEARFTTKIGLDGHILDVHEKKYPFKCSLCSAAYANSKNLKRHFVRKHDKNKPFPCNYCDAKHSFSSDLKAHMKIAHKNEPLI